MPDKTALAGRPRAVRSALSNHLFLLPGVDLRTSRGRRWRDIMDELIEEFGTGNPVGLRELAGLKFSLEEVQVAVVRGDAKARDDLVRICSVSPYHRLRQDP
jgi:hypothetical protein